MSMTKVLFGGKESVKEVELVSVRRSVCPSVCGMGRQVTMEPFFA